MYGTPIRVSKILRDAAGQYPKKKVFVYLNDNNTEKIELLRQHLPKECANFHYSITIQDANERLKQIGPKLALKKQFHFFLLYDPYDAAIDWTALAPFFVIGARFLSTIWFLILCEPLSRQRGKKLSKNTRAHIFRISTSFCQMVVTAQHMKSVLSKLSLCSKVPRAENILFPPSQYLSHEMHWSTTSSTVQAILLDIGYIKAPHGKPLVISLQQRIRMATKIYFWRIATCYCNSPPKFLLASG